LEEFGLNSEKELNATIKKLTAALKSSDSTSKTSDSSTSSPADSSSTTETSDDQEFPLLEIPDEQLTAEQKKEKKKQAVLKAAKEGRLRAALKRKELEEQKVLHII
jgi:actin-related protein 5